MAITTFNGPVASQNGFQLPSFTNSQILAIPNPATGLLVFNSSLGETAYFNGTTWVGATLPVAPSVSGISPPTGAEAGGTSVTISGSNFVDVSAVTIGGTPVTSYTVVSPTSITAVTAAHAAGSASVNVTNAGGTNAPNTLFTYAPPNVTYVAGVDFQADTNAVTFSGMSGGLLIQSVYWTNTTGFDILASQPAGVVYTVQYVAGPDPETSGTLTQTTFFTSLGGGAYQSTATGIDTPYTARIVSITFTPVTTVTYTAGEEFQAGEQALTFSSMSGNLLAAYPTYWTDTAALAVLTSQPSGKTYNILYEGYGTQMSTSVSSWAFLSGYWSAQMSGGPAGPTINIVSITFAP